MKKCAILVLENIWWDLNQQNGNQASVRPFFEGLSHLNETVQTYYMTFVDANGFEQSLDHLLTAPQERLFVYVASHGYGARLGNSNFSNISKTIGTSVALNRVNRVEGVIFGACEIGGNKNDISLEMLHWKTGIAWVFAYRSIMDWMPSTLIDLNIIMKMLILEEEDLRDRQKILDSAASALTLFNPEEKIGWSRDAYAEENLADISVKDSIRFLVKPRGRGNIFRDDTNLLIEASYGA